MKSFWKRKFIWDVTMAVLVIVLPMLLYCHLWFSEANDSFLFFGFEYVHREPNNNAFIWQLLSRVISLLLLSFWYLNCPFYWRCFILIPVIFWLDNIIRRVLIPVEYINYETIILDIEVISIVLITLVVLKYFFLKKLWMHTYLFPSFRFIQSYKLQYRNARLRMMVIHKTRNVEEQIKNLTTIQTHLKKLENSRIVYFLDKKNRFIDVLIIMSLISSPYAIRLWRLFPENVNIFSYGLLSIRSNGFPDIQTYLYYIGLKLTILIPIIIWYVTERNWWKHALLVPFILTVFQMWEMHQDTDVVDQYEMVKSFPVLVVSICFIIIISRIVRYNYKTHDLIEKIKEDIDFLIKKNHNTTSNMTEYDEILNNYKSKNSTKRLQELIELKKSLLNEISEIEDGN